jgi:uncharacterized protein (DUF302 family)
MGKSLKHKGYTYRQRVELPFDEAVERVTAALKEEGFGVLTEIDMSATLKQKLDVDYPRYLILGACNPHLAHEALRREREIGALLPCNVVVYDDQAGGSIVVAVDPRTMLGVVGNTNLEPIGDEAAERLQRALNSL